MSLDWDQPCPGCSATIDELSPGVLTHVASRETALVLASRAPYQKIAAKAKERGWTAAPWYSSHPSDFNYDYQVTLDAERGHAEYNYRSEPGLLGGDRSAEMPGYSCFLREGDEIFHTYSAYGRGTEYVGNAYTFLDMTALGRQEDWEEPKGRVTPVRGGDPHVHQLKSYGNRDAHRKGRRPPVPPRSHHLAVTNAAFATIQVALGLGIAWRPTVRARAGRLGGLVPRRVVARRGCLLAAQFTGLVSRLRRPINIRTSVPAPP
jgi:predicted dithiol-disulfide oxidoreductase (DUF899 family)